MAVAIGVPQDGTVGTTAAQIRRAVAGIWQTPGIVTGCSVSGTGTQAYSVSSGVAVCRRATSDGMTIAAHEGGSTNALASNDSSMDRLDAVWVTAHDRTQGDADNLVTFGATQGTPASSPVAPAVPSGALLLAVMRLPAGATTTSSATRVAVGAQARPIGASLGVLMHKVNTETSLGGARGWKTLAEGSFAVPTRRTVRVDVVTCAKGVRSNVGTPQDGSMHVRVLVDGSYDRGMGYERQLQPNISSDSQWLIVTLDAGTHTVSLQAEDGTSGWQGAYGTPSGSNGVRWQGQVITVTDMGVAA